MPTNRSHSSAFSIVARSLAADGPGPHQQRGDPLADLVLHAEGDVLAAASGAGTGARPGTSAPCRRRAILSGPRPSSSWPRRRDRPAVGPDEAGEEVEDRGLAGTVGPDERHDHALAQGEREVVGGHDATEALRQPGDLEHHRRALPGVGRVRRRGHRHRRLAAEPRGSPCSRYSCSASTSCWTSASTDGVQPSALSISMPGRGPRPLAAQPADRRGAPPGGCRADAAR